LWCSWVSYLWWLHRMNLEGFSPFQFSGNSLRRIWISSLNLVKFICQTISFWLSFLKSNFSFLMFFSGVMKGYLFFKLQYKNKGICKRAIVYQTQYFIFVNGILSVSFCCITNPQNSKAFISRHWLSHS
jgi:hypothetical protein